MDDRIGELEAHRTALTGHCYRMLGPAVDADGSGDHDSRLAGLNGLDGRAWLRTWLYRQDLHETRGLRH